jgi:hypothetical protein
MTPLGEENGHEGIGGNADEGAYAPWHQSLH